MSESPQERVPGSAGTAQEPDRGEELSLLSHHGGNWPPTRMRDEPIFLLVLMFNAVTAGLSGLYLSTRSVAVVAVAAGLVALLGVLRLVVGRQRDSRRSACECGCASHAPMVSTHLPDGERNWTGDQYRIR